MNYTVLIILYLHLFACMRPAIKLHYSHPNASNAEYLINHAKKHFIEDPAKARKWAQKEAVLKEFNFSSSTSGSVVHMLFFDSQTEAIQFEKANNFEKSDTLISVLNGGVLYIVEGVDRQKIKELAGWFAGQE